MNKDIYGILKKAIASGTLSPIDLSIAEHACDKYERDLKPTARNANGKISR